MLDRRAGVRRGRLRLRQVRPRRPRAPTTSTSARARTRPRRPTSWPPRSWPRVRTAARSPTPTSSRPPTVVLVGLRARGGEPDRLPAAAQGRAPRQDRRVCRRALRDARPHQAGRHPHPGRLPAPRPRCSAPWSTASPATVPRPRPRRRSRPRRDRARRRAPGHRARRPVRGRCPRRRRPAPGSPGCRAAPVSAVRSRPARCRPCCPAAARSPTPAPASRSPRPGTSWACRTCPVATAPASSRAATTGSINALVVGGVDAADLADPRAEEALAKTFVVSLELPALVGDRRRRRRPAGGPAGREGRHLRRLGGPPAVLRGGPRHRGAVRLPRPRHAGQRDGRLPRHPHAGRDPPRDDRARSVDRRRAAAPRPPRWPSCRAPATARLVLATWHHLLDRGSLQDGEPFLAGTAATAARPGVRRHRRGLRPRRRRRRHGRPPPGARSPPASRSPTAWSTTWSGCRRTPTAPPSAPRWGRSPVTS